MADAKAQQPARTRVEDMTKAQLIELLVKVNRRQKIITTKFTSVRAAFKVEHTLLAELLATGSDTAAAARVLALLEEVQAAPAGAAEADTSAVLAQFGALKAELERRLASEGELTTVQAELAAAEKKRAATMLKMRELVGKVRGVQQRAAAEHVAAAADREQRIAVERSLAALSAARAVLKPGGTFSIENPASGAWARTNNHSWPSSSHVVARSHTVRMESPIAS